MPHTYDDLPAAGIKFSIKISAAFVEIPGVSDFKWDGQERGVREPAPLSSASKIKKPGMTDFGEISATVNFDPNNTTHRAIRDRLLLTAAEQSAAIDEFQVEFPDGAVTTHATAEFDGFVSGFNISASDPDTGTLEGELTVTVSGTPTYTEGVFA